LCGTKNPTESNIVDPTRSCALDSPGHVAARTSQRSGFALDPTQIQVARYLLQNEFPTLLLPLDPHDFVLYLLMNKHQILHLFH
jgi:hypothetical protein